MPPEHRAIRTGWLRLPALDWWGEDRAYAALLDALTANLVTVEAVEREMDATSRRPLAEVQHDSDRAARDERQEARRELGIFRAALEEHRRSAGTDGGAEVAYDSADAEQDSRADVLIQYLVRAGYAEVHTEEQGPGHYRYAIRVDWPRLQTLGAEQGHPLPADIGGDPLPPS